MNPLVIVIPVVVVLAGVVLFAASRRRDSGGATGALSRETIKRDKPASALDESEMVGVSGRQVEASAALDRRPAAPATVSADIAPFVAPFHRRDDWTQPRRLWCSDTRVFVADAKGWLRFQDPRGQCVRCSHQNRRK